MFMKQVNFIPPESRSDRAATARIFEAAREKNQHNWAECFAILKAYGIPVVNTAFAKTVEEAVKAAEEMGYLL